MASVSDRFGDGTLPVRPVSILVVEDSPSDAAMTVAALREGNLTYDVTVVGDGEAAMEQLRRDRQSPERGWPDLVLLDLNLPKKDGWEVLREVKADPDLAGIPVVVFTSSEAASDIAAAYACRANCYVTKPVGMEALLHKVRGIEEFWLSIARIPERSWII